MRKIKYILLFILPFLLIACQSNKFKDSESIQRQWQIHQQDLKQINAFQVNGNIAYYSTSTRNYGRFFIIQQSVNRYEIKITTPVGTNILSLKVDANYAELVDNDGKHYTDTNVEDLMKKITNINIPFNSLHDWLKGYSNDAYVDKLDKSGRLASSEFMQNDNKWNLKIPSYMTRNYKNRQIDLPSTIELSHGEERVRLKINNWIVR